MQTPPMTAKDHPNAARWGYMSNPTPEGSAALLYAQERRELISLRGRSDLPAGTKDHMMQGVRNRRTLREDAAWNRAHGFTADGRRDRPLTPLERSIKAERAAYNAMIGFYGIVFILFSPLLIYYLASTIVTMVTGAP